MLNGYYKKLYDYLSGCCESFFDNLTLFERNSVICKASLNFCKNPDKIKAEKVYQAFLKTYRIPGLDKLISTMRNFEENSSRLISYHRDHYIHSVNVFILGISFYASNEKIRNAANIQMKYPDQYKTLKEEFLYRWGMASLFHDIGYPIEIAFKTISEFSSLMMLPGIDLKDGIIIRSEQAPDHGRAVVTPCFSALHELLHISNIQPKAIYKDSFDTKHPGLSNSKSEDLLMLVAENISKKLGFASGDLIYRKYLDQLGSSSVNKLDHGMFSAIVFLKWINAAFIKSEWNPVYFYIPIVDSATAMLLHNSYGYLLRKAPYNRPALEISGHVLTFLLILSDNIQEYSRVNYGYKKNKTALELSELMISDDSLTLKIKASDSTNAGESEKALQKLKASIEEVLDMKSVFETLVIEKAAAAQEKIFGI